MAPAEKFMFNMDFDADGEPPVPDAGAIEPEEEEPDEEAVEIVEEIPKIIVPTFSEEQLETAKKQAYQEGLQEGTKNASKSVEGDTLKIIRTLTQHLTELFGIQEQTNNKLINDCIGISSGISRKLFPSLNEKNGLKEITDLVEKTLLRLIDEPRVIIRISPDQVQQISEKIDGLKAGSGYEGRIIVKDDENIAQGDCRLEWGEGSAERNAETLWNSIDEIVQGHLDGTRQPDHIENTIDVTPDVIPDVKPAPTEPQETQ